MNITNQIRNRKKPGLLALSYLAILLILIQGCSKSDDSEVRTNGHSESQVELSMDLSLSSFKKLETVASSSNQQLSFSADHVMTGQLSALNTDSSVTQNFDWTIYLDEENWAVQSNKTILLNPGAYEFSLLLVKGNQQYAGSAFQVVSDGTAEIPMTIRPVIGNTITDVSLVGLLADFKFQYDPEELSLGGFSDPRIGIIVDSGNEAIFTINPVTGLSDNYVNLDSGSHTIHLKLYDGCLQRGRSIAQQESVLIAAGLNIAMDLVALQGQTTLTLTEEGGSATFGFTIPDDVIDEAGGSENLEVLFSMVGSRNSLQENILALTPLPSGDFQASITLAGIQVDLVTISLAFKDTSTPPGELLGSCSLETTLDTVQRSVSCDLILRRRAVVSGSLLATLGINVLNNLGEPIPGAAVSNSGNILGVSGSGMFGSPGYIKLFMNTGSYILKAETAMQTGIGMAVLAPLSVNNLDITIENRPSFTRVVYEREEAAGNEIYIMDADGLNQSRLTFTSGNPIGQNNNVSAQYSMYLDQILFNSNRDGSDDWSDLYVMELDGSNITALTTDNQRHGHFALSIDGLIYYSHWNSNTDLYYMNLDGSNKTLLSWSSAPDVQICDISINNQILYSRDEDIHRIDNFGTGDIVVGEKVGDLVFLKPTWSPDGMKILAGRHNTTLHELWLMEADGTNRVQIDIGTLEVGTGYHRFSPDGTQVLFSAAEPGQPFDIYVANVDGSDLTNLTNTPGISEAQPFPF